MHHLICAVLDRSCTPSSEPTATIPHPSQAGVTIEVPLPRHPKRIMIWTPPRHGKSDLVSVNQPAKLMGDTPTTQFMCITYGSDLAGSMSKSCVTLMGHEPYKRLYPEVQFERKAVERWKIKRKAEVDNGKDSMIASGIKSPLTGEGASRISVDDPYKNKSEAYSKTIRDTVENEYQSSIYTRRAPGCVITLTLTRWHEDDLAGRLLARAAKNKRADQWLVVCLPAMNDNGDEAYVWDTATGQKFYLPAYTALWPGTAPCNEDGDPLCSVCGTVGEPGGTCPNAECGAKVGSVRYPRVELDKTKAGLAEPFWLAMYQQRPTNERGGMFKRDKWGEAEGIVRYDRAVHVWDTALEDSDEADYTAYEEMLYTDGKFVITDAWHDKLDFPALQVAVYAKWHAALQRGVQPEAVLIENKGSGISLLQTIEANNADPYFRIECVPGTWVSYRLPIVPMPATVSKEIRALSIVTYQNAGLVALPKPTQKVLADGTIDYETVEWLADFIEEHAAFPRGKHDDWVDATVHALTYYTRPVNGVEEELTVVEEYDDVTFSSDLDDVDRW